MNIHEVAKAAGVSIATVSRVVNHPESVSEKTREKVLAIMNSGGSTKKDYRDKIATKQSRNIAVVLPSQSNYPDTYEGILGVAEGKNYHVFLCVAGESKDGLLHCVQAMVEQSIDGMILATEGDYLPAVYLLQKANFPFVCIGSKPVSECCNSCYINYRESAAKMAQYLAELNCRSVHVVSSPQVSDCREALEEGFLAAWKGSGRSTEQLRLESIETSFRGGEQYARLMLQNKAQIPDAVLCQSDETAAGIIKAAGEMGLSLPADLRVVGFCDSAISAAITPELTTVEQPTRRLGMAAARRLFDIIGESEYFDIESQEIALKGRLKIRRSCGNDKAIYEIYE